MGVVTGIPMEFQFGTNWAAFSRMAGGVVGQTLAMEGIFSFFLESAFLGLVLFGEKKLGPKGHAGAVLALFVGTWLSGYFIVATNAWMQHPVGYTRGPDGRFELESLGALFTNPWFHWQYFHTMLGSCVTAGIVMASVGAYYLLAGRHEEQAKLFVKMGATSGFVAALLAAFPTGDQQAKLVAEKQPATFAAMEGVFHTERGVSVIRGRRPAASAFGCPFHVLKLCRREPSQTPVGPQTSPLQPLGVAAITLPAPSATTQVVVSFGRPPSPARASTSPSRAFMAAGSPGRWILDAFRGSMSGRRRSAYSFESRRSTETPSP